MLESRPTRLRYYAQVALEVSQALSEDTDSDPISFQEAARHLISQTIDRVPSTPIYRDYLRRELDTYYGIDPDVTTPYANWAKDHGITAIKGSRRLGTNGVLGQEEIKDWELRRFLRQPYEYLTPMRDNFNHPAFLRIWAETLLQEYGPNIFSPSNIITALSAPDDLTARYHAVEFLESTGFMPKTAFPKDFQPKIPE